MIFEPLQYDSGLIKQLEADTIANVEKGDPLYLDDGVAKVADDNQDTVRWVALQTGEGLDGSDDLLALYVDGVEFVAETDSEPDAEDVGEVYDLDADGNVDLDSSNGNVFYVAEIEGPASDKKVRGYFLDRVTNTA